MNISRLRTAKIGRRRRLFLMHKINIWAKVVLLTETTENVYRREKLVPLSSQKESGTEEQSQLVRWHVSRDEIFPIDIGKQMGNFLILWNDIKN